MRENGRKSEYKSYRKYGRVRSALHRWTAILLGVVLLAGQLDISVYAMEESAVYGRLAADATAEQDTAAEYVPAEQSVAEMDEGDVTDQEGETPEESEEEEEKPGTEEQPTDGDDQTGEDGEEEAGGENGDDETPEDENDEDETPDEEVTEEENAGDETTADEDTEKITPYDSDEKFCVTGDIQLWFKIIAEDQVEVIRTNGNGSGTKEWKGRIPPSVKSFEHGGKTYRVTKIGDDAFEGCPSLTEMELPDSITVIGNYAFRECKSLTRIVIPDSVEKIGQGAFLSCEKLVDIVIPDKSIEWGNGAFSECNSLTSIIIPPGMTEILPHMFRGCRGLVDVTIPDYITVIGEEAFQDCKNLEKLTIPSSVKEIGNHAFSMCDKLTEISMADGVERIGDGAFSLCHELKELEIPDSVTSIEAYAFSQCKSLERIKLSSQMTDISNHAFLNCSNLMDVTIPQGITNIKTHAFAYCHALPSITIPSTVTYIEEYAFRECKNLDKLKIAVVILEEGDQKKVNPVSLESSAVFYMIKDGVRHLIFLTADGKSKLVGDDFAVARAAYLAVSDGNTQDDLWYRWQIDDVIAHTITATAGEGGTITPSGSVLVAEGDDKTFTITPNANEGYQLTSIMVDGEPVQADGESEVAARDAATTAKTYTFQNVTKDHEITVSFEKVSGGDTPGDDTPPGGGDKPGGGSSGGGNDNGSNDNSGNDNSSNDNGGSENGAVLVAENADTSIVTLKADPAKATPAADSPAAPKNAQGKEPKTGDSTHVEIYATIAMIAGFTYLLLYFMEERRGMTEREKEVFVAAFIRWAKKGGTFRKCCALAAIFCILAYYHSVGKRTGGQECYAN